MRGNCWYLTCVEYSGQFSGKKVNRLVKNPPAIDHKSFLNYSVSQPVRH